MNPLIATLYQALAGIGFLVLLAAGVVVSILRKRIGDEYSDLDKK